MVGALAIAAHGVGGGEVPDSATLTLLLVTCGGVGAMTTYLPTRFHGRLGLVASLGLGQLAAHYALTLTDHPHSAGPALPMFAAHALATAICALLIASAERIFESLVHVWHLVVRGEPQSISTPTHSHVSSHHANPVDALLRASISRRGPPVRV
ncbi:hypothetical protein BFN03_17445 [Rhodococcus sp. WMMA185]|nr:hypothetical protein BFN03_17445 [Rhodococcus sp. WMMA185]